MAPRNYSQQHRVLRHKRTLTQGLFAISPSWRMAGFLAAKDEVPTGD
jgi:hypothetical protein